MKPYKCKNKQCRAILGYASAQRFETGGIVVDHLFSFDCQSCEREHVWKPAPLMRELTAQEASEGMDALADIQGTTCRATPYALNT